MNELALFAGAGGGILGSILLGHRIVCAVEINPYCREILLRRQEEDHIPPFPIWDDVRSFDGRPWRGVVDIVSAGFPCQPFSLAGQRRGADDHRNMWPDTIRVIREVGPRFAFLENVPGLVATDYFGEILGDLAEAGFDAEWGVISAAELGAPHVRERLWILANSHNPDSACQPESEPGCCGSADVGSDGETRPAAYATSQGLDGSTGEGRNGSRRFSVEPSTRGWWSAEPGICGVDDGVAYRVDRIRALGNGQVPIVAATAWNRLMARKAGVKVEEVTECE